MPARTGRRGLVSFSSNDYLALAHHPEVVASAQQAIAEEGVGSGASRLVTGTHPFHEELETNLAGFKGVEASLTFSSGFATAAGFASAFLDQDAIVLMDKLAHACLIDAVRASKATMRVFRHNDVEKLESLLQWARERSAGDVFILTESVFSMDGDLAPLKEIVRLKEQFGAQLLVDEAHAVGVLGPNGRGLAASLGLTAQVDFHMGTLGKAVGVSGGYLAGERAMIEVMKNRARSFIYSTAPPPVLAKAASTALAIVQSPEGDRRRALVKERAKTLATRLDLPAPSAAILPLIVGTEEAALEKAAALRSAGLYVPAIRYPTVARGAARLRIALSAAHTEAQIESLTRALGA